MIEHGVFVQQGPPMVVARERSVLPCGCFAAVGVRMDRTPPEVSVGGSPCSQQHRQLLERFRFALTDSLVNPTSRPLIDVVDELLVGIASGGNA